MKTNISGNPKKRTVVTIGNFDGLHKGHLALINKVCALKNKYDLYSVVFTFSVNTKFSKNLIFPQNQLKEYLKDFPIDYMITPDFEKEIMGLSCEEFVKTYICDMLKANFVVVGENFLFGKGKSGNAQILKNLGKKYGFETVIVKSKKTDKKTVSSTLLREYIKEGKIQNANKLMYRNFSFSGKVKKGYHIGTDVLSIPTANISVPKDTAEMKKGVYITLTTIDNNKYKSITNVGKNPTNPKKNITVETNILDFDGDIYGKRIKVEFLKYIRNEMAFKNQKVLKRQIEKDISKTKKFFGS